MSTEVPFVSWEKTCPCKGNAVTWFNHVLPLDNGGLLAVGYTRFDMDAFSDQSLYCVKITASGKKEWEYIYSPPELPTAATQSPVPSAKRGSRIWVS